MLTWRQYLQKNSKNDPKARRLLELGGGRPNETMVQIQRKGGDDIDISWLNLYEQSWKRPAATDPDTQQWKAIGEGCYEHRKLGGH